MGVISIENKYFKKIKKLMDPKQVENQNYIKEVLVLFIERVFKITYIGEDLQRFYEKETLLDKEMEKILNDKGFKLDGLSLGKFYEEITSSKYKKKNGQVYTPHKLAKYMIEDSIRAEDIIENPGYRVLDPSCGSGFFLVLVYRKLLEIFLEFKDQIIYANPFMSSEYENGIGTYIVKNCIFGVDKDEFSVNLSKLSLKLESGIYPSNIVCKDILLDRYDLKLNLLIGNPPYIGVKNLESDYKKRLKESYGEVYTDKADISYCFFQRAYDLLYFEGKLNLINSRYMIEALYAEKLRGFILDNYDIRKIIDFYGENIFKGISVSPAIFSLRKSEKKSDGLVYGRPNKNYAKNKAFDIRDFDTYKVDKSQLNGKRWILEREKVYNLFKKIENQGSKKLKDIISFNQGIITGCDKAFILEEEQAKTKFTEVEFESLKPWIKNSDIEKYRISKNTKYLIYTKDIEKYKNIRDQLENHREILEKRRECRLGIKNWYEIQWERDKDLFKGKRIVFPYKSKENRFVLLEEEVYHSADIYSGKIRNEFIGKISKEYILAYLNSSLFEFYFKIVAKKMGSEIYEYYPNRLNDMSIIINPATYKDKIEGLAKRIIDKRDVDQYQALKREIDKCFFELYGLDREETEIVAGYIEDA